jgi:hypothetical protein
MNTIFGCESIDLSGIFLGAIHVVDLKQARSIRGDNPSEKVESGGRNPLIPVGQRRLGTMALGM